MYVRMRETHNLQFYPYSLETFTLVLSLNIPGKAEILSSDNLSPCGRLTLSHVRENNGSRRKICMFPRFTPNNSGLHFHRDEGIV